MFIPGCYTCNCTLCNVGGLFVINPRTAADPANEVHVVVPEFGDGTITAINESPCCSEIGEKDYELFYLVDADDTTCNWEWIDELLCEVGGGFGFLYIHILGEVVYHEATGLPRWKVTFRLMSDGPGPITVLQSADYYSDDFSLMYGSDYVYESRADITLPWVPTIDEASIYYNREISAGIDPEAEYCPPPETIELYTTDPPAGP